jgi:acyl-CoA reductase-like NAD-dependent aldehyde dehydrogenase
MTLPPPLQLDALGPDGPYTSRRPRTISDVTGRPAAELSLAPLPYVSRAMSALSRAEPLPRPQRLDALAKAGELFRSAQVEGLTADAYADLASGVSGLGITTVRAATDKIARYCAAAFDHAQHARPAGAVTSLRDPDAGCGSALWSRRGRVFAVQAAGNHPAVHADWIQALALGYNVAVRPSTREPLTAHRLVSCLRLAGFADDHVLLLPSDHAGADEMVRAADRSLVYGGDAVVAKYAAQPHVLAQGPGRSKILITREEDWHDHLDLLVDSVSRGGGTGCTNATAIFVEGDPRPVADAIAQRLAALRTRPPRAEDAILPVHPSQAAQKIVDHVEALAKGTSTVLAPRADDLGDGSSALRPALFVLNDPQAEQARQEVPFPCVWVGPWTREAGTGPLKDSLVLTALTRDPQLTKDLVGEPSIRNLYLGPHPTYWNDPRVPHDGYLADFLMESRGILRSWPTAG